jgi:hypothetical protein
VALINDFRQRFPEFSQTDIDLYVPILSGVWQCYYGGEYDEDDACSKEIVLNLVAHMLVSELSAGSGNLKSLQSKSVGSVSASYAPGLTVDSERKAWFSTTKYGLRYLLLTRPRQGGVFV